MLKVGAGYFLGHVLTRIQIFLILPVIIRSFSQEQYGTFETLMSIYMLCSGIAIFNFDALIPRFLNLEEPKRSQLFKGSWWVHLIVGLIILAGAIAYKAFGLGPIWLSTEALVWSALAGVLFASNQIVNIFFRSTFQHRKAIFFLMYFSSQFAIAGLLAFATRKMDVVHFFQALSALYLISAIVGVLMMKSNGNIQKVPPDLKSVSREALPLLGFTVIAWILNFSDRILVSSFLGVSQTAEFGFAIRLASLSTLIFGPFQILWLPWAMKMLKAQKSQDSFHLVASLLISAIGILIGGMFLGESLLLWFFSGGHYHEAFPYVAPLVVAQLCLFLYYIPMALFVFRERAHFSSIAFSVGAALNVGLNLILIPAVGLWGPVISNLIGYSSAMIVAVKLTSRLDHRIHFAKEDILTLVALLVLSLAPLVLSGWQLWAAGFLIALAFLWRGWKAFQVFNLFHKSIS